MATLLLTNQSYADPTTMLNSVVNDAGASMQSGAQEDVHEYWLNFVERLEEGLGEKAKPSAEVKIGQMMDGGSPLDYP